MEITNNTNRVLDFNVGVKDGVVLTEDLGPRETKDIKVKDNDPQLQGYIFAGVVTVKSPTGDLKKIQNSANAPTAQVAQSGDKA